MVLSFPVDIPKCIVSLRSVDLDILDLLGLVADRCIDDNGLGIRFRRSNCKDSMVPKGSNHQVVVSSRQLLSRLTKASSIQDELGQCSQVGS